jgi:hypothetical protein
MGGEDRRKPYDFGNDFKSLTPEKRVGVIETARGLLKIQKKAGRIVNDPVIHDPGVHKKQDRQALPEECAGTSGSV